MLCFWVRYFGPMLILVSDQEGAAVSDLVSRFCDRYNITRSFAGTDDHTLTGLAERFIFIVRTASLKTWNDVRKQGLQISQDECVSEAAMCTNMVITHGDRCPDRSRLRCKRNAVLTKHNTPRSLVPNHVFRVAT